MFLNFENFKKAGETVDQLLRPELNKEPRAHLNEVLNDIPQEQRGEFLQQFSSLLINVILNRRQEVGEQLIERVKDYRRVVANWNMIPQ